MFGQVGAQVMLLRNLELTGDQRMLVNGSRGVVVEFKSKEVWEISYGMLHHRHHRTCAKHGGPPVDAGDWFRVWLPHV